MIGCTRVALFAALGLAMATPAFAGVDLIAAGQLDGHGGDLAYRTSGPLENNVPGNVLGGLGSGLAYAGWAKQGSETTFTHSAGTHIPSRRTPRNHRRH